MLQVTHARSLKRLHLLIDHVEHMIRALGRECADATTANDSTRYTALLYSFQTLNDALAMLQSASIDIEKSRDNLRDVR